MQFKCSPFIHSTWQAAVIIVNAAVAAIRQLARFAFRHRESVIGGVAGYVLGRAIESIPFVGPLLSPLASMLLGGGGGVAGYQKELERRRIEVWERGAR